MIKLSTEKWSVENIETVLFDKDGTFIDLHFFWGKMTQLRALELIKIFNLKDNDFEKLCLILGYDIKSKKMLSNGITALYSRIKIIEILKNKLEELGVNTSIQELENIFDRVSEVFYKNIEKYTKPIPEAIKFIKELRKKGIKIGIVTSDSVKSTNLTLKQYNWENLFDVVIGRESSEHTKESGEPTKLALKLLNADPKTTLMIGDAPMDYVSAKNAGIENVILVATGQIDTTSLQNVCNKTCEDLMKIKIS